MTTRVRVVFIIFILVEYLQPQSSLKLSKLTVLNKPISNKLIKMKVFSNYLPGVVSLLVLVSKVEMLCLQELSSYVCSVYVVFSSFNFQTYLLSAIFLLLRFSYFSFERGGTEANVCFCLASGFNRGLVN